MKNLFKKELITKSKITFNIIYGLIAMVFTIVIGISVTNIILKIIFTIAFAILTITLFAIAIIQLIIFLKDEKSENNSI